MLPSFVQKVHSWCWERWLRIDTTGWVAPTVPGGVHYTPLPYRVVFDMLRWLKMTSDDVFVDVGCGKGRVLSCASRYPLRRVTGIEVNPNLIPTARDNLARVRGRLAPAEVVEVHAEYYDYADTSILFLYNPFGAATLAKVVTRLRDSLMTRPRRIQVAYANCLHEAAMARDGWIVKADEWPEDRFPGFRCPVSFWRT